MAVTALISDFGGVLTTPLAGSFEKFHARSGVSLEQLGIALATLGAARGENPLFALETGRLTEAVFLAELGGQLGDQIGRPVDMDGFGQSFFADLAPNEPFVTFARGLRDRGLKMAICTNNVREWSTRWRAMVPVEEIFEVIVDSSEVGARKPDPRIYEETLAQLGVSAGQAVFVDDLEPNVIAARELGLHGVWFQTTEQAIADVEAALAGRD
jgi:epoxide hydrolase-like predicted phosphatase